MYINTNSNIYKIITLYSALKCYPNWSTVIHTFLLFFKILREYINDSVCIAKRLRCVRPLAVYQADQYHRSSSIQPSIFIQPTCVHQKKEKKGEKEKDSIRQLIYRHCCNIAYMYPTAAAKRFKSLAFFLPIHSPLGVCNNIL